MAEPLDVVIITAAEGEDTALLEVSEGVLSPWTQVPSPEGYASEVFRTAFESLTAPGTPIHVVTTRPPRMGGDHAAVAAGQLLGAFKPRCIAICGVCAGRRDWTSLGDVIIADRVWRYDTGERHNPTPGGRPTFKKDTELFALSPTWLRAAENAKRWATWPGDGKAWLEARPRPLELQGLWLMKQLAEGLDPAEHPDVGTMCSHWTDVTAQLEKDGLVVAGTLTDQGREHLAGVLFKHQKRLPEPRPWALHVTPMGTGNHLVRDVDIWASLEDEQRLVCGFDMEASTIGLAAWAVGIPFLAVKGVMDFGLPERHRGFRDFAARASAEVLVRLLRTLVPNSLNRAGMNSGRTRVPNLPRGVTSVFKGRESKLGELEKSLDKNGTVALTGLGGMGKTRLALEYASRGKYDVCWWVRAANVASLQEDLVKLGQMLELVAGRVDDIEQAVAVVLEWLSTTRDRWLLVLDDAPGPEGLLEWLPARGRGHVVITSRAEAWAGVAEELKVDELDPEASRELLLELSKQKDEGSIEEVAKALGYLPLALVQAGAFMNAASCSFRHYLEHLKVRGLQVFRDRYAAPRDYYQKTVAATWEISMKEIHEQSATAAALLDWLAFLDPDGVPVRLLTGYPDGLPPEVAACVGGEGLELDPVVAVLRRFSMVDRVEQPEPALRVHRLVQAVTRDKLGDDRRRELATEVVAWVRQVFAYTPDVTRIKDIPEGIGEQLMAVGMLDVCVATSGHELTWALSKLGEYRMRRSMLSAARVTSQRAREVAEGLAKADPHSAKAQRDLAVSLNFLGDVEVQAGNLAVARELFQRYYDIAEGLAKADPQSAEAQRDLPIALERLGNVEVKTGNLAAARELFQRSLQTREGLAKADRNSTEAQNGLAVALDFFGNVEVQAGNLAVARDLFQRSLQTREGLAKAAPHSAKAQRDLAVSLNFLGDVEVQAGNLAAARDLFQRYYDIADELAKADPHSAGAQRDLSLSLERLGNVEVQAGNLAAARNLFQRYYDIAEELAKADPQNVQAQRGFAVSLHFLGKVEVQAGNLAAARDLFQRYNEIAERLAKADLHSAEAQRDLSISLDGLGDVEVQAGDLAAARGLFQRSLTIAEGLAKADLHNAQAQRGVSIALERLGNVEAQAGDLAAARDLFQRSLTVAERLAKADPHSVQAQRGLAISLKFLGNVEVQAGNLAAARDLFRRFYDIVEGLAKADPHSARAQRDLAVSLSFLGNVEVQAGNLAAARDLFQRYYEMTERLATADLHNAQAQRDLSISLDKLGAVEMQAGNLAAARDLFQRSLQTCEGLAKTNPHSAQAQRDLAVSLRALGLVEVQTDNLTKARELLQRAADIFDGLAKADPSNGEVAFEVVVSLLGVATVAEMEENGDALRRVVTTANELLGVMDAIGQIAGYQQREAVRELVRGMTKQFESSP